MTLPQSPAARKPPSRAWLFGPYIVLLIAIVAWSGAWLWIRGQVADRLQASRGTLGQGPTFGWSRSRIGGYPFRIEVILDDARAAEPSGWALAAPQVRAESYAYDLKHWVAYAPNGMVLSRPGGGDVAVTGQALRASLVTPAPGEAELAAEGLKLAFAQQPGAKPFPLTAVDHIDAHTRPAAGTAGATEFLVQIQGARLTAGSALGRIAAGQPVSSAWHGTISQTQGLAARDWPALAKAWAAAGGSIVLADGWVTAGPFDLHAGGGQLSIGPDGRLRGKLTLGLARAPASLAARARAGALPPDLASASGQIAEARRAASPAASADLTFQAGVATFGPIAIGPAPRIY